MGKTMANENQQQTEQNDQNTGSDAEKQISEAEAQAQFEAGFTGKPIEEPAKTEPNDGADAGKTGDQGEKPANAGDGAQGNAAPGAGDTSDARSAVAGLSDEQLRGLLAKASKVDQIEADFKQTTDRLFGKIGELNRTLQERTQAEAAAKPAAPAFDPKQAFSQLYEEYPDLADSITAGITAAMGVKDGKSVDDKINEAVAAATSQVTSTVNDSVNAGVAEGVMNFLRPGWRDEMETPDFALFKSQMPEEALKEFSMSWDPHAINSHFDAFDEWKAKTSGKPKLASGEKPDNKQERLRQAAQPRGTGSDMLPSENDAFEAGFNGVRGVKTA